MKILLHEYSSLSNDDALMKELRQIIKVHLEKPVQDVRAILDSSTKVVANKLKLWALAHMHVAKMIYARGLMAKILNNPHAAATQLVQSMLYGTKFAEHAFKEKHRNEPPRLTDPLDSIDDDLADLRDIFL